MAFNRDNRGNRDNRSSGRGGGFRSRPSFGNRSDRGPVEMHEAICDNCGKTCQVPFRPTSGKPVYCSSCFENNRSSEPRRFEDRREQGNPYSTPSTPANNYKEQFDALNSKLDRILTLLSETEEKEKEEIKEEPAIDAD